MEIATGTMDFHTTKPRAKNVQRHFHQHEGNAENKTKINEPLWMETCLRGYDAHSLCDVRIGRCLCISNFLPSQTLPSPCLDGAVDISGVTSPGQSINTRVLLGLQDWG